MKRFITALNVPIRDIVLSFVFTPTRFFCSFIPKDSNILVFGSWMGNNFSDNPRFFYDFLRKKLPHLNTIVVVDTKKEAARLRKQKYRAFRKYSILGLYYASRAKLLFVTHSVNSDINICTTSNKNIVINFWHGSPGKKLSSLGYLNSNNFSRLKKFYYYLSLISNIKSSRIDYMIAASSFSSKIFMKVFHLKASQIKLFGYPRNDILFNLKRSQIKTILYLPTYRIENSDSIPIVKHLKDLDYFLKTNNYDLVVKAHPAVKKGFNFSNSNNIFHFENYFNASDLDAQIGMKMCDVLITDYSGILFDFFLTDKPIIFFPYDFKSYSMNPGLSINYLTDLPGPFVFTVDELIECIRNVAVWSKNPAYIKKYKQFKNKFNEFNDQFSSQRLLNFLISKKYIRKNL